jgi:hypothetical protein
VTDQLALAAAQITITDEQRNRTLELIRDKQREIGDIRALRTAGVAGTRGQLRSFLDSDEEFREQIAEARGRGAETIRDEIRRRAIEGVDEPVFHQGDVVGHVRKYSDRLLGMMAKAHLPEYRERVEVTGADGAPVPVTVEGARVTSLTDVFALARALGIGFGEGLRAGASGEPVPTAPPVLPDPGDG